MFSVKIGNCTYRVSFRHNMETDFKIDGSTYFVPKSTECIIQLVTYAADQNSTYDTVSTGKSYCSNEDQFNYNKGRKLSLARALRYYLDASYRELFWNEYFKVRGKY